jgi:transcription initiation factor TFIIIB Brf1 subunit/transcription initiation factor TFIIB
MPTNRENSKKQQHTTRFVNASGNEKCKTENIAFIILKTARELDVIRRKGPIGVASAACYIASKLNGEKISLKKISELANVPEETIIARYNDVVRHLLFIVSL